MDQSPAPDDSAPRGEILARLTEIEQRLAALEDWREKGAPRRPVPIRPRPSPVSPSPVRHASIAPVAERIGPPIELNAQPAIHADSEGNQAASSEVLQEQSDSLTKQPSEGSMSWEQIIAGRWYAYAGAVILVMGVALGLKWAYDVGLLRIAPTYRCLLAAGFGFVLLAAGREVAERVSAWAAGASYVAGIGVIYASVYAAFQLYALLTPAVAFLLLGVTSALGVGVATRSRLASVGVVSLLAGYVAPVLLWEHSGPAWALPAYLSALLIMGSAVAWVRGGSMWLMSSVATVGTLVLGGVWILQHSPGAAPWAIALIAFTWLTVQSTMSRHAREGRVNLGLANSFATELDEVWNHLTLLSSLSVSVWAALLGASIFRNAAWSADWSFAATTTIACAALGAGFAPVAWTRSKDASGLNGQDRSTWRTLVGWGFWLQAGVLLGTTVLLALDGHAEAAAWVAMGLGATLLARRLGSRAVAWYGAAAFFMLVHRAFFAESWNEGVFISPARVLGLELSWRGAALMVGAGGCAWAIWVRDRLGEGRQLFPVVACLAVPIALIALGRDASHGQSVLFAWILMGSVLCVASRRAPEIAGAAVTTLVFSLGAWTSQFVFDRWSDRGWPLLLHPGLISAVLLATALGPMWWWAKQTARASRVAKWMGDRGGWAGGLLLLVASSLYLRHAAQVVDIRVDAREALLSMWWGIFGFVAIGTGFAWRSAGVRRAGLVLLAIGAAKAVLIDLADASTLWRVVSFLALGALLMTVGIGYRWIEKRLIRQGTTSAAPPPTR